MADQAVDSLETQVNEARRSISSDGYPMSIGELTNLYRDGELKIRPEFQRFFRWTPMQKSRLIESLLLGIPIPSIFVSQNEAGKWELVDGLQRISTILELQGELRDASGGKLPSLILRGTKFLPSLEGRTWDGKEPDRRLSEPQRLDIKRAKLDIKIIKRESSPQTKYDLFQRLNSYGSALTAQELRSALLVAVSPNFFSWLERLALYPAFVESTALPERDVGERFDLELVLRFLILHNRPASRLTVSALRDFSQILDDESVEFAKNFPTGAHALEDIFKKTFDTVSSNGAENIFRRWDVSRSVFRGPFLITAFEVFGLGLGYHVAQGTPHRTDLLRLSKEFWAVQRKGFATGRSTEDRLAEYVPIGRKLVGQ